MKGFTKFISIICMFLIIIFTFSIVTPVISTTANAETTAWYLSSDDYGYLSDKGNSKGYNFTLDTKAKVNIQVTTYYDFYLVIKDSNGDIIYEKNSSEYDVYSYYEFATILSAGKYRIVIVSQTSYAMDYDLYCYASVSRTIKPKKVILDKKGLNLSVGSGYNLHASYTPSYATGTIKFKSSNKKVATVSDTGYIYANKMGKTTITASVGKKKAKCIVYVNSAGFREYGKGTNKSLLPIYKRISGYSKGKWTSSKPSVVKVDQKGNISCVGHGYAKISLKVGKKKYTTEIYSYDKAKLKKETISVLKDTLYVPSSLKVNTVKYIDFKRVRIYYSAFNTRGERLYDDIIGYYEQGAFYHYSTI